MYSPAHPKRVQTACPRCGSAVHSPNGTELRCLDCDYPGIDARLSPHSPALGDDRVLSGKAVAAMVLGITSVTVPLAGLATGITAIPLAVRARHDIRHSGGLMRGQGQANAGLAMGVVGIAVQALLFGGTLAALWRRWA